MSKEVKEGIQKELTSVVVKEVLSQSQAIVPVLCIAIKQKMQKKKKRQMAVVEMILPLPTIMPPICYHPIDGV